MNQKLQSIRGMNDILPDEARLWETCEADISRHFQNYGYSPIRLPIVEATPLFCRAIGEVTDIVEKEMYSFTDSLNGEQLTLRPEGTAGCARAVIQHNLASQSGQRLYYMGPMFRHERPQKGRYRQFHQVGVETFGFLGPDIEAEQILMLDSLWKQWGITGLKLQVNTLGEPEERARHRADLIAYLVRHESRLDEEAKRRLYSNPLRILDTKNPDLQPLCDQAPRLIDYLGEKSLAHFAVFQKILKDAGLAFEVNPRLVRGLDYYNLTVFEWVTDQLGAQGTVCAGGRYDHLVSQLGGKPLPACGFAIGMERLVEMIRLFRQAVLPDTPHVYVVHQGEAALSPAFCAASLLREKGVRVALHCGGGSFKAQMKKADASGARFAVIIGEEEALAFDAQIKDLRSEEKSQQRLKIDQLANALMVALNIDEKGN